jgi:hypothetical protein
MNKLLRSLILFFLVPLAIGVNAQSQEYAEEIIQQRIEELASRSDEELDFSELFDHFLNLYQNPININTANQQDLEQLMFLNDNQIMVLLAQRKRKGAFQSIYELKDLDGFYVDVILAIEPFISLDRVEKPDPLKLSQMLKYGRNQVLIRYSSVLEDQAGYMPIDDSSLAESPNSRYLGDKNKLYFRYKYTYRNKVSFGLLGDKDAGEEFFTGNNSKGFDFYSAHFFVKDIGKLKAAAIGDYHLEFGQGLTLWSGLGFGKSVTSISMQRQARGLRANTSANEVLFFRGAAATYSLLPSLDLTAFYSSKGLDAGLSQRDTSDFEDIVFSTIQESGMHRTPNEVEKKSAVQEQIFGANLSYRNNGFKAGFTAYTTQFDKSLEKDVAPYQYYDFQGKENFNAGIDASYANSFMSAFGELAMSKNIAMAMLVGAYFNLHPRLNFSVYYRKFDRDYQNFYAIPISESGKAQNEEGVYLGAVLQMGAKSSLRFYYDIFKFPWLKFRVNGPSAGNEFSLQYERNPNRSLQYYVRYQYEDKLLNYTDAEASLVELTHRSRHNMRFHLTYRLSSQWKLQSRLTVSRYQQKPMEKTNGYLLYQDVEYKMERLPLQWSFRYAVFNTDDYDTRIYAYEKDVLYKFSIPAYAYQGQRYYLMAKYDLNSALTFWLRFSQTFYHNRSTISSGLEEIDGNKRSEITAQLQWKF